MHENVTSRDQREQLKAEILRSAIEDNVDAIQGRLPAPLRASQQRLRQATRWGSRAAIAGAIVLASIGIARQPANVTPPMAATPGAARDGAKSDAATTTPAPATGSPGRPDETVLSRTVDSGVLALSVRRIVIDAGHGGENLGTSSASGLTEKDVTLDIAERVRQLIAARGFEVVMTRTADDTLSLQQRAATANGRRGDIFVSIHLNALAPASAKGIETYYLGPSDGAEHDAIAAAENQHSGYSLSDMRALLEKIYTDARRDQSRRLAAAVQKTLVARLRTVDRSLTDRGVKMAPFVVLGATEMPAILAEVSCLSNREEAERLSTTAYRQTIAEAVVAGIQTFALESRATSAVERTGSSGS